MNRVIVFVVGAVIALRSMPALAVVQSYSVRTLRAQIPSGVEVSVAAAVEKPGGVEIVGVRRFHNGGFDRTPMIFPTSTSGYQLMSNPASDSTQGFISAAAYVPALGVLEAGQFEKKVGSTVATHAVVWNGTPTSAVDLHQVSNLGQLNVNTSIAYGVSASPAGFQATGIVIASGRDHAIMWTGASPETARFIRLHDDATMFESRAMGAYVHNGVAKQVGFSYDILPGGSTTQPRARVWSGSSSSAVDLTPTGYLYGVINAGSSEGDVEVLSGHVGESFSAQRPVIWLGTSGVFRILSTTSQRPAGSVVYSSKQTGVGYLVTSGFGAGSHAAVWNLETRAVTDLHSFLPSEFQNAGATSEAFYVDSAGYVYGQASASGGLSVPVVWLVPEPASGCLLVSLMFLMCGDRRRQSCLDNIA